MADQGSKGEEELHVVLNFFEKIQKPPGQDSYEDGMKHIYEYVRRQPSFLLGQLHKNLDPSGQYPYVNYVGFKNGDFHVFQGKAPKEWIEAITGGLGPRDLHVSYPGGYAEIATLSGGPLVSKEPKTDSSCYLLINYKESEVGESNFPDFEANWKTKSGANIVMESFPDDIKYGEIALYRRRKVGHSPFMYVLRCEILPGAASGRVLEHLPVLREKLGGGGIPYSDVSAYGICYLCHPKE